MYFLLQCAQPYDVKREQKNLYVPGKTPPIVEVPGDAVRGGARGG